MTDQEKKERTKKNVKRVWDGSKLVMAIGALTAAVNGYMELSKKSVQLSEQNAALYKALSSKVNGMAERLAYMEGRIDGLSSEEAEEAVKDKIGPRPARAPASEEAMGGGGVLEDLMGDEPEPEAAAATAPASEEFDDEPVAVLKAAPPPPPMMQQQQQYQAYEELPDNLEALMQDQEQVQEEM